MCFTSTLIVFITDLYLFQIPLVIYMLSLITATQLLLLPRQIHMASSTLTLVTYILTISSPTVFLLMSISSPPFETLILRLRHVQVSLVLECVLFLSFRIHFSRSLFFSSPSISISPQMPIYSCARRKHWFFFMQHNSSFTHLLDYYPFQHLTIFTNFLLRRL